VGCNVSGVGVLQTGSVDAVTSHMQGRLGCIQAVCCLSRLASRAAGAGMGAMMEVCCMLVVGGVDVFILLVQFMMSGAFLRAGAGRALLVAVSEAAGYSTAMSAATGGGVVIVRSAG